MTEKTLIPLLPNETWVKIVELALKDAHKKIESMKKDNTCQNCDYYIKKCNICKTPICKDHIEECEICETRICDYCYCRCRSCCDIICIKCLCYNPRDTPAGSFKCDACYYEEKSGINYPNEM